MVEIRSRLTLPGSHVDARLELSFEDRQKSRLKARLDSGETVALMLTRGEVLRGGDLLLAADGRVVEIVAKPEQLLHVECDSPAALARAAYHLGNRHVPVQVGATFLRLEADHVLEGLLRKLGASVRPLEAPFEPEAGAYHGHAHGDDALREDQGGRIHEYGERTAHDPDHHSHESEVSSHHRPRHGKTPG